MRYADAVRLYGLIRLDAGAEASPVAPPLQEEREEVLREALDADAVTRKRFPGTRAARGRGGHYAQ